MLSWQEFEKLAQRAHGETAPSIDVAGSVVQTVRERARHARRIDAPLVLFAGAALVAALLLAMFAWPAWDTLRDPLVPQFKPLSLVMK